MDWNDKLGQSRKLFADAKALLASDELTTENRENAGAMMADAQLLKADAIQLKDIEAAMAEVAPVLEKKKVERNAEMVADTHGNEFKSMGDMLATIRMWAKFGQKDPRLNWYDDESGKTIGQKNLAEAVGATGGFLVPTEFIATLYSVLAEGSLIRQRATIIPMRRRSVRVPVLDQTGTTAGVPHWFGGMAFYWAEEGSEKTETDPAFRRIELVAHKLIGYTVASDELVDDSAISLEAFLMGELGFVGGARWHEEYSFINGTGAGQPLGVILAGATITVARAAQLAVSYIDLANMVENFLPSANGMWLISQSVMSNLLTLQDALGNYVWQPNARDGLPTMLFGYPAFFTEKCPRVGTAGDVILADWKYYLLGDRQAATVESTQFDRWRYDETSWRMVHRVDGQPWLSAPLTYQDGTSQVSPFVILGDKTT